jgi:hypothetical protein
MKWMEIHQDMGERFKIKLTMRLKCQSQKKDALHRRLATGVPCREHRYQQNL